MCQEFLFTDKHHFVAQTELRIYVGGQFDVDVNCKICGNPSDLFSKSKVLGKYEIKYFSCPLCHFIQAEEPFWLEEAYASAINRSDIGYLARNLLSARVTKAVACVLFDSGKKFVDYGGGYGVFVRLMRDQGFDFFRYDKYCQNLFALDFEADAAPAKQYELLTSFEVFEHLSDPLSEIESMLSFSDSLFFSTVLQPTINPLPGQWWYYGLDHGQHISLYHFQSLQEIARKFNLRLHSDGRMFHLLTKRKFSNTLFKLCVQTKLARMFDLIVRRHSLLPQDREAVFAAIQRNRC